MNKKLDENPYAILLGVSPETIQEAKENFDSLTETAQQALKHLNIKGPIFDIPASAYGYTEFHQALGCMELIHREFAWEDEKYTVRLTDIGIVLCALLKYFQETT